MQRLLLLLFCFILPAMSYSAPFFNSSEVKCDANAVMCEDFETSGVANSPNGKWYGEDCDAALQNGGLAARTKGWCGTINANPITPAGAASCGSLGIGGTDCVGDHGEADGGTGGVNMADHSLESAVEEVYIRWYQKWLTGYSFSGEKVLTINENPAGFGGIDFGNFHCNCGAGGRSSQCAFQWQPTGPAPIPQVCLSLATLSSGVWYFIEAHIILSTNSSTEDGTLRVWINNCGAAGDQCTGSPTLVFQDTSLAFLRTGGENIQSLWFENWANNGASQGSIGTSYIDQIIVSTVGPIGFMDEGAESEPVRRGNLGGLASILLTVVLGGLLWYRIGRSKPCTT